MWTYISLLLSFHSCDFASEEATLYFNSSLPVFVCNLRLADIHQWWKLMK